MPRKPNADGSRKVYTQYSFAFDQDWTKKFVKARALGFKTVTVMKDALTKFIEDNPEEFNVEQE